MDSPRKNNDCYFYYYSTCLKGDGCTFRHEPAALGCETVCTFWQQGKCLNQRCNFRHMELRKNRKIIPCYWENQPGGCRKPHCSFQHKNPREAIGQEHEKNKECENVGAAKAQERADWSRRTVMPEGGQFDECVGSSDNDSARVGPRRVSQGSETSYGSPPVDPLVVNFEEESDNESVPTSTPTKKPQKNVHVKTLEEIRLERIQAESAAFYSYKESTPAPGVSDLRSRIAPRKPYSKSSQDFRVLTLEEIRKRKSADGSGMDNVNECLEPAEKRLRNCISDSTEFSAVMSLTSESPENTSNNISVKSLANTDAKCNASLGKAEEHTRKRTHSPITFDVPSKKSSVLSSEEHKNRSVINKENNGEESKADEKELLPILKKFRKPLRRGHQNEVSDKEQPVRVIRLRRKNVVANSYPVNVNIEMTDHQVSSVVPASTSFETEDNVLKTSASSLKIVETNGRTISELKNGNSSPDKESLHDNFSDTVQERKEEEKVDSMESLGATALQSTVNCDTMVKDKWSSCGQDDELFLDNNEYPVVLRAEDDILQDIDELLRD